MANIKRLSDVRIGDTITDAPPRRDDTPARLPGAGAGRLLRPVPGHAQRVRRPAHRLAEALAQRFELHLRARDLRRARLRFPLRLSGHAPHGDRPAAPGAREQPVAGANRPQRHLRDRHSRQGETLHISNPTRIPDAGDIEEFREPVARVNFILPVGIDRRDHAALRGPAGHVPEDRVHHADPRHSVVRVAPGRDDLRPLR